jgi:hypothetical protein
VYHLAFLTYAVDGGERSASGPVHLTAGINWIARKEGGRESTKSDLDTVLTPGLCSCPARSPLAIHVLNADA